MSLDAAITDPDEGLGDGVVVHAPYGAVQPPGDAVQGRQSSAGQRDVTSFAIF